MLTGQETTAKIGVVPLAHFPLQFINCSMIAVDFMSSDLTEVLFDNCNLRKAVFIDTIANKADFYTSYDYSIDPEKNKLKKAVFSTDGLKGLLEKYDLVVKT